MSSTLLEHTPYFLRQRMLGSEAVYEVLHERAGIVTAEVVKAPGLEPGTQLRLTAHAARAMERLDAAYAPAARRRRATASRFAAAR
jgi:hypothetical protein